MFEKRKLCRRGFMRLAMLSSAALGLAACAPKATPTPKPAEKKVEPTKPPEKAPAEGVQLSMQLRCGGDQTTMWVEFYEYFHDKHPNISKVDWWPMPYTGDQLQERLLAQMIAGDAPDVYGACCGISVYFIQQGQALNLQPYIDKDAEFDVNDFTAQQFNPWKLNGDIHATPYYTGIFGIFYNKDMFDEEGVAYPGDKWGEFPFEDYYDMCNAFVRREEPRRWGSSNYGLTGHWPSQVWFRGFGTHVVDPEDNTHCLLCEPAALECLEYMRELTQETHGLCLGDEMGGLGIHALFSGQRMAMKEMGSWGLKSHVKDMEGGDFTSFNWDAAPFWNGPGGITTHQTTDGQQVWFETKHPQESWLLARELCSPAFEKLSIAYEGRQPSRKSLIPDYIAVFREHWPALEDVNLEIYAEAVAKDYGAPEEYFAKNEATQNQILKPAFERVLLLGDAPVELICKHAEVATKYNRGEIELEDLQGVLDKIKV